MFNGRFKFSPANAWKVGVERESFIYDPRSKQLVPRARELLDTIWEAYPSLHNSFGYELSACQLESRTEDPLLIGELAGALEHRGNILRCVLAEAGYQPLYEGVGPEDMPLDIFPDPTGRYERVAHSRPREQVLAACRIIGTHIHIGMPDAETALRVYNGVIRNLHGLRISADKTGGERMRLYRVVVPQSDPVPFASWSHFHQHALEHGYAENIRDNWMQVRITRFGAIEFRLFDGTESIPEIVTWARECRALCRAWSF